MRYALILIASSALAQSLSITGTAPYNVVLTNDHGSQIAALQFSVTPPATVTLGPAGATANKAIVCGTQQGSTSTQQPPVTCIIYALNTSLIGNGVVAVVNSGQTPPPPNVTLSGVLAADAAGNAVSVLAVNLSACDVNGDGKTDNLDVLAAIAQVTTKIGLIPDLTGDGQFDLLDVMRVLIAATGGACKTGQ